MYLHDISKSSGADKRKSFVPSGHQGKTLLLFLTPGSCVPSILVQCGPPPVKRHCIAERAPWQHKEHKHLETSTCLNKVLLKTNRQVIKQSVKLCFCMYLMYFAFVFNVSRVGQTVL